MKITTIACMALLAISTAWGQESEAKTQLRIRMEKMRENFEQAQQEAEQKKAVNLQFEMMLEGMEAANGAPAQPEKLPHLGVSTVETSAVLCEQLALPRGLGLVVDYVDSGSPAQQAGIKQYDILMKFDDQRLANPEQLRALLRLRNPGDAVKLSLIRRGKPEEVTVKLGQKQAGVVPMQIFAQPRAAIGQPRAVVVQPALPGQPRVEVGGGTMITTIINGQGQFMLADEKMSVSIQRRGDKTVSAVAKDREGKTIFEGPIETAEQRKAMPAEVAKKVEQIEKMQAQEISPAPGAVAHFPGMAIRAQRSRVLVSALKDVLMLARFENARPSYVLAFSTVEGKVLFDGPVATEAQRKELPGPVARQLDLLEQNQHAASEFGSGR